MLPEERDHAYVWDMLQAALELQEMNQGASFEDFIDDIKLMRATERSLEIVGEAARRLSSEFKQKNNQTPWHMMIGQRNIIAYEYGQIDYEMLYKTVLEDVPIIIIQLKQLLLNAGD